MKPSIYKIEISQPGSLYVMPKPSNEWLREDISDYQVMGIKHIISLLEDHEISELGLQQEASICQEHDIKFSNFKIADRGLPEITEFTNLAHKLASELEGGNSLAIHCRIGIGRAGVLASCVLQKTGLSAQAAISDVSRGRGVTIPDTPEQLEFIKNFQSKH